MKFNYAFSTVMLCLCLFDTISAQQKFSNQKNDTQKRVFVKSNSKINAALKPIYDGLPAKQTDQAGSVNNQASELAVVERFVTSIQPEAIAMNTLVISEIMYNSPVSGADSLEYIEIHNPTSSAINLNGYSFTGVNYTFGNVSIPAGGYVVVCDNSSAMKSQFGVNAFQWKGALTNGGELLLLKDSLGRTVDSVRYDDSAPWPGAANGKGASLVLCDFAADNSLGANWLASSQSSGKTINGKLLLGSPGFPDSACGACLRKDSTTVNLVTCDFDEAGITVATLQNIEGCDSVVTTIKTYDQGSNGSLPPKTVCQGDSLQIFGVYQSVAATYYDTLSNINGCDSIVSQTLIVNPVDTIEVSDTTMNPADVGVEVQIYIGSDLCDSVVITTTTYVSDPCVIPDSTYEILYTCNLAMTGMEVDTFMGSNGCDSLHSIVKVHDPGSLNPLAALSVCEGDSVLVFGDYRSTAGTYYDTLTNRHGCDSVLSRMVSVNPVDTTYLSINSSDSSLVGVVVAQLMSKAGCDSVVITTTTYEAPGGADNLRITEIMYNPPESGIDTLEYIEIYNAGSSAVNLNGYEFTEGVNYTFGNTSIGAGDYVVVGRDSLALFNTFGISAYEWSGTLVNGGEDIVLKDNLNRTLDSVEYDNNSSWPAAANGSGSSLVLCDLSVDQNDGGNWRASVSGTGIISAGGEVKGSPGSADQGCETVVDCQLSAWSVWSICDTSCGGGRQFRTRTIIVQGSGGGVVCDSTDLIEYRACNTQACSSKTITSVVSDSAWTLSTVVTTATANSYPWPGVASVPDTSTFTLPVVVGQPYPWEHLYTVNGSQVISAGSGVTYYRRTFQLTDSKGVSARFRMFVDDDMEIFINGNWIALEDGMGIQNWRTVNHDILFNADGTVLNPNAGGDPFDYYTTVSLDNVFRTGNNDIVLPIRNRTSKPDVGGFSFRMDLDKDGEPVIVDKDVSAKVGGSAEVVPQITIYPNPTDGMLNIIVDEIEEGEMLEIQVYDISGKRLMLTEGECKGGGETQLDLSGFDSGVYTLRIKTGEIEIAKAVMVK